MKNYDKFKFKFKFLKNLFNNGTIKKTIIIYILNNLIVIINYFRWGLCIII